jgi:hypothetical protein
MIGFISYPSIEEGNPSDKKLFLSVMESWVDQRYFAAWLYQSLSLCSRLLVSATTAQSKNLGLGALPESPILSTTGASGTRT